MQLRMADDDSGEPHVCVNGDHLLCLIIKNHLLVSMLLIQLA